MKGYLVLEDGKVFEGEAFGAFGESPGEVVFNTGMTGYQEVLTDPSYCGQIVTMTYPLIGNYGINPQDYESSRPHVRGFVVKELCQSPSHWRSVSHLSAYLAEYNVTGLSGIDTRALTRHLRTAGTMRGVLLAGEEPPDTAGLVEKARAFVLKDPVQEVTTPYPYHIMGDGPRIVVVDYGVKQNILRCLSQANCDVYVVPASTPAEDILDFQPQGIVLSNGPGDPEELTGPIQTVKSLVGQGSVPIFGICLGHQVLSLALGGRTYKLKFGHRGANHPVKDFITGRTYITSQNHGYAVDDTSLPADVEITHRNLNDGTVEGMRHKHLPILSVQYHPEAHPGPEENRYLFDRFLTTVA